MRDLRTLGGRSGAFPRRNIGVQAAPYAYRHTDLALLALGRKC